MDLTLSKAIRIGAKKRPQCFKSVFKDVRGLGIHSCVVGAAYEALWDSTFPDSYHAGMNRVSNTNILKVKTLCPSFKCHYENDYIIFMLEHLNDVHYWTREQIADWVESIERLTVST